MQFSVLALPCRQAHIRSALRLFFVLLATFTTLISSAQLAGSGWPMWEGNAQNTCLGKGSGAQPVLRWLNFLFSGVPIVGPDGTVYVAGSKNAPVAAINGQTGSTIWSSSVTSGAPTMPALGSVGALYGGDKLASTYYLIDSQTGVLGWSTLTLGAYTPMAVGTNGYLYGDKYPSGNPTVVTLSSGQSVATVPAQIAIAAGSTTGTFTIKTLKVTAKTSATISASATGTTKTALLTITP